jgi:hypothetical protein
MVPCLFWRRVGGVGAVGQRAASSAVPGRFPIGCSCVLVSCGRGSATPACFSDTHLAVFPGQRLRLVDGPPGTWAAGHGQVAGHGARGSTSTPFSISFTISFPLAGIGADCCSPLSSVSGAAGRGTLRTGPPLTQLHQLNVHACVLRRHCSRSCCSCCSCCYSSCRRSCCSGGTRRSPSGTAMVEAVAGSRSSSAHRHGVASCGQHSTLRVPVSLALLGDLRALPFHSAQSNYQK